MVVIHGHCVLGHEMSIAPVLAVRVLGRGPAAYCLNLNASGSTDSDLDRSVLQERPIDRVIVIAEGGNHPQHQVAPPPAIWRCATRGVAPCEIAGLALEQAGRARYL